MMTWRRIRVVGVVLVATALVHVALDLSPARFARAVPAVSEARREAAGPEARAARRRWALAKMDEMAHERQRCRERFKAPGQVSECEAQYARRYREYNEIYLEVSRD